MKKKKKKKTHSQLLEKELDVLWQKIIVERDKVCLLDNSIISCGHHIFPKSQGKNARWEVENGIGICIQCHYAVHFSTLSAEYNSRIQEVIGMDRWNRIRKKSNIIVPYIPIQELKDKLCKLKSIYSNLPDQQLTSPSQ